MLQNWFIKIVSAKSNHPKHLEVKYLFWILFSIICIFLNFKIVIFPFNDFSVLCFQLRQTVRKFCAEKLAPHADEIDKTNEFPRMRVSCTEESLISRRSNIVLTTLELFHKHGEELCLWPLTEVVNTSVLVCPSVLSQWLIFLSLFSGVLEGNGRDGTAWYNCSRWDVG